MLLSRTTITRVLLTILLGWSTFVSGLFEDQVGKFDWHQKYFGPIRFLLNDLNQPKRVIVGTLDNVIGAVNSNTGAVLYRHVLESDGNLLYLGNLMAKEFLTVSSHRSTGLVKVRSFITSNGIASKEWSIKLDADYATEFNSVLYLVSVSALPTITVTSYDLNLGDSTSKSSDKMKSLGVTKVATKLIKVHLCEPTGAYLVCVNDNIVAVIDLRSGTVLETETVAKVTEISATSSIFSAVALKGNGFVRVFKIVQSESAESSLPTLVDLPIPDPAYFLTLSQAKVDDTPVLFVTRLVTAHSIQMDAFDLTHDTMTRLESYSRSVSAPMLLSSLALTKTYCLGGTCGLIGFTKDELLFGTKLDPDTQDVKVTWSRQEALASTLAVETVDYPSEAEQSWNPYSTQQGPLTAFLSRLHYELDSIVTGDRFYTSNDDRFGVNKVIIFVTAVGKVIGMDGSSGQILYAFLLPDFRTFKDSTVFLSLQRQAKYAPLKPLASVVYPSAKSESTVLFAFNPIEGQHLDEPQTFPKILQAQMMLHGTQDTNYMKPVVLLDKNSVVHTYPSVQHEELLRDLFFFVAEQGDQTVLKGLKVMKDSKTNSRVAKVLWQFSLGKSELIGVHSKLAWEKIHSQGRVLPDRSVSYKYMNPNLVAVVTAEPDIGNVNVFLIDAVSGAVIHSFWHKKSRGPVHLVHTEHWLVYSLFNEKNRRYELTSVELYEGQTQSNSTVFSSFAAPAIQPIVIKQSYIFPTKIDFMAYTRTEKGITNKDILLGLPTGGIVELPKFVMQPRLSPQHHQIHQDEDGVIHSVPYIPELPMPSEAIINYNQSVKRIRGIGTWPTRLESTCLVLVYGKDIFYTKVSPSKQFDVLKDDFDHWFIMVVLVLLCIGAWVTKRLSAKKQLEQAWR